MKQPILTANALHKDYQTPKGTLCALDTFNFSVSPGEVVGLLGPNGSGKSTFVKMILSLVEKTRGSIQAFGQDTNSRHYLKKIGAIVEGNRSVNERLTILENAKYYCRLRESKFDLAYFNDLIKKLGVTDTDKPCRFLSTGNKQKAAIVCALIHRPELVLLDEPTLGLDSFGTDALLTVIREQLEKYQTSFLISSHDFDFIQQSCHRITVINKGNKVFEGNLDELIGLSYRYKVSLPRIPEPKEESSIRTFKRSECTNSWTFFISAVAELQALLNFAFANGVGEKVRMETFELKNQYMGLFK